MNNLFLNFSRTNLRKVPFIAFELRMVQYLDQVRLQFLQSEKNNSRKIQNSFFVSTIFSLDFECTTRKSNLKLSLASMTLVIKSFCICCLLGFIKRSRRTRGKIEIVQCNKNNGIIAQTNLRRSISYDFGFGLFFFLDFIIYIALKILMCEKISITYFISFFFFVFS